MKKSRIILTIVLVVLIGFGWLSQVTYSMNQNKEFNAIVAEADLCCERKLYKKAINLYEDALKMKENENVRNKWFEAYSFAWNAEEITHDEYMEAMNYLVEMYPQRIEIWEALISESLDQMDFNGAKDYYEDAIEAGADKQVLSKYKNIIYYSVSEKNRVFSNVLMSSQGYFTVFNGSKWGIMDSTGEWVYECNYDYIGPIINKDVCFLTTSKDSRVYNDSQVVQAILSDKDLKTKAIKEGIIPICKEEIWTFYDYVNEQNILDEYDDVSCFINGKVAVKKEDTWSIIDKSGQNISDTKFDDIKLLGTGEYAINGTMIAAVGGNYGIYDESGKSKCDFTAANMDICMGEYIAFEDSEGKWGFVDTLGEQIIEPQFDEAMSFSNGLAAVKSGDQWGFINKAGELVIDYKYSSGGYFNANGVCFVGLNYEQVYMILLRFNGGK